MDSSHDNEQPLTPFEMNKDNNGPTMPSRSSGAGLPRRAIRQRRICPVIRPMRERRERAMRRRRRIILLNREQTILRQRICLARAMRRRRPHHRQGGILILMGTRRPISGRRHQRIILLPRR
ncbi:hypothetical protein [Dictyobacter vulcani]|uniref:hypothetical protein n=1 Tax=Dictyobacter vulcani TaxID=2607529 RepID=UPI0013874313|nr:hypothetical protein [Dictyobacter vulcani]